MRFCGCALAGTDACNHCPNNGSDVATGGYNPKDKTFWKPEPQQGWVCPKCGNVYAPTMPFCTKCNGGNA